MNEIKKILTDGLLKGYGGKGVIGEVNRAGFHGKQSDYTIGNQKYHDEWFASSIGGGQELVSVGDTQFTRVYAGGTPELEKLQSLGITHHDIGDYLINKILELEDKTRLFEDCKPQPDGDWQYSYEVVERHPTIEITTGRELITYRGDDVHIHMFILCPIK